MVNQHSIVSESRSPLYNLNSYIANILKATDIQEEEIRMSLNSPYVKGTSEKLWRILRSHKIRWNFYTEKTLHKLLRKPKDQVDAEDKNNIAYEIDCSNY